MTGALSAVPLVFGAAAMIVGGWNSDRTGERVWHVAGACIIGAVPPRQVLS